MSIKKIPPSINLFFCYLYIYLSCAFVIIPSLFFNITDFFLLKWPFLIFFYEKLLVIYLYFYLSIYYLEKVYLGLERWSCFEEIVLPEMESRRTGLHKNDYTISLNLYIYMYLSIHLSIFYTRNKRFGTFSNFYWT